METASQWIVLAHILRPQGRKGEVLADLFTDFPERFDQHPRVWLAPPDFAEQPLAEAPADQAALPVAATPHQAEVAAHWLPLGRNAGRIVLHFAGVDTIEQAEQLAGKEVIVPLSERLPLDSGAAYISDLIGATVYDRDLALGVIESVQFPTSPDGARRLEEAAPLLAVMSPEGDEILIPFASAFILDIDLAAKSIRMALPEGLTQINSPALPPPTRD
jgi:16S rRNA processing protein RimM